MVGVTWAEEAAGRSIGAHRLTPLTLAGSRSRCHGRASSRRRGPDAAVAAPASEPRPQSPRPKPASCVPLQGCRAAAGAPPARSVSVMSRSPLRALSPGAPPRLIPAAPATAARALLPPWPRRPGRRWPASPLGMKVFRRKALVLCAGYALLLVLTMLNLLDYKWHKEPLQQCSPDGPPGAAAGAAGGGWGRPGPPPAVSRRAHTRMDPRTPYRPPAAAVGAAPAAAAGAAAPSGNSTRGTGVAEDKRQLVYVFTTWRSGSSFFGELFNQNPEVFFLYEPVWHVWQKLYPGDAVSLQGAARDMLSALYRCDLSVFQLYSPAGSGGRNLTTLGIFGAATNKVVCSSPLCPAYRKEVVGKVCGGATQRARPSPQAQGAPAALTFSSANSNNYLQ